MSQSTTNRQDKDSDVFITIKKSTLITAGIALAAFILGGVAGYFVATSTLGSNVPPGVVEGPQAQATGLPSRLDNVSIDDDPSIGPPDAPVVIVEFSDFM